MGLLLTKKGVLSEVSDRTEEGSRYIHLYVTVHRLAVFAGVSRSSQDSCATVPCAWKSAERRQRMREIAKGRHVHSY